MKNELRVAIVVMAFCLSVIPSWAQASRYDRYLQAGTAALSSGDYARAETNLQRAVKEMDSQSIRDRNLEQALAKLATAYRQNQKYTEAGQTLNRAIELCRALGVSDPEVDREYVEISKTSRLVDLSTMGRGSEDALRASSAVVTVARSASGSKGRISMPARFEHNTGSDKVDQIGLEKEVEFDIVEDGDGTVRATNIKGFKIHSVEKQMWVNLLAVTFGPMNAQGEYDSVITAGKMGVTKNVNSVLSARTFAPVKGIVDCARAMSSGSSINQAITSGFGPTTPVSETVTTPSSTTAGTTFGGSSVSGAGSTSIGQSGSSTGSTSGIIESAGSGSSSSSSSGADENLPAPNVTNITPPTPPAISHPVSTQPSRVARHDRDDDDDDDDDEDDRRERQREKMRERMRDRDDDGDRD